MGIEGTRRETTVTIEAPDLGVPADSHPTPLTDDRAATFTAPDAFISGSTPVLPEPTRGPVVGHPLFVCRFLTSEIPGARPLAPGVAPANPEEVLQAFEDELVRFESLPEDHTDEATASLDQLECLALQLEALPTDGLETEALRNRHIAVLRSWSVVRTATVRLSERLEHAPDVMVNDTGSSDRMRAAARRVVEVVTETADPEDVEGLETRLDAAIDNDDAAFLIALSPESVENFLATHQMARALFDFAEQDTSEDRLTGYLESARNFASLGLNESVTTVLTAAARSLDDSPEPELLDGLFAIASVYQESGMIDEANSSLLRVSFIGENSMDPECRERGTLAHAMQLLNRGEFGEAEAMLLGLPDSELRQALLNGIYEGERRARVLENMRLLQGYIVLYSETHEFASATPREIRTELLGALRIAAETALSGENPNLMAAFTATRGDFPTVASFVFDGPYTDTLTPLMNPDLENDEYGHLILTLADRYMDDGDYTAASIVADAIADDPDLGEHAAEYSRRIEYHTARESLSRSGMNYVGDFLSVVPARIVTGIVTGIANAVYSTASVLTLGALGGTIEDNMIGTAELALIIASEGLSVEAEALFVGSRFAAGLSEAALTRGSLAVRSGTMATAMAPGSLLLRAAHERSLESLTWTNLGREFGANLVLFGLMHGTGRFTHGSSAPVRWGVGVGSFVAADYTNEFLGFHDPSEAGFEARLESSILGDFNVRFATWVGGRISGGHYERLARETAVRRGELVEAARRRSALEGDTGATLWADLLRGSADFGRNFAMMSTLIAVGAVGPVGIGPVPGGARGGTRRMGMVPEIGLRSLRLPEVLANLGTNAGRFDQLAGIFESVPEYEALNRASRDAAETERIREEVRAELGGRYEGMRQLMDALRTVLSRHGIDMEASRSALEGRVAGGEVTSGDARGIRRLADELLYQFYPGEVPLYRSVHLEYAGRPGTFGVSGSDWLVGELRGPEGESAYRDEGTVLIRATMGEIRSAGGRVISDVHAWVNGALTVVHPEGRAMPYEVVDGPRGGTVVEPIAARRVIAVEEPAVAPLESPEAPPAEREPSGSDVRPTVPPPGRAGGVRIDPPTERAPGPTRYIDLNRGLRTLIDRFTLGAAREYGNLRRTMGDPLRTRDLVVTRRIAPDGTLYLAVPDSLAREMFIDRLVRQEGADEIGENRFRLTTEEGVSIEIAFEIGEP